MDVAIVDMPAFRAGAVRGDLAHAFETWERLWGTVGGAEFLAQPGVLVASVMPVDILDHGPEGQHYDAAVFLPDGAELPDGLLEEQVPAGRYARATYIGPYDGLGGAWGEFTAEWLPSSGHEISGEVCYEIYRSDPNSTPPEELRTELYIPVA